MTDGLWTVTLATVPHGGTYGHGATEEDARDRAYLEVEESWGLGSRVQAEGVTPPGAAPGDLRAVSGVEEVYRLVRAMCDGALARGVADVAPADDAAVEGLLRRVFDQVAVVQALNLRRWDHGREAVTLGELGEAAVALVPDLVLLAAWARLGAT